MEREGDCVKKWKRVFAFGMALCLTAQYAPVSALAAGSEEEDSPDVILAYKTHFDIGFTDYAANVVRKYQTTFIDNALNAIEESSSLPENEQFKWIVPGWPFAKMSEGWEGQTEERLARIEKAMEEDRISAFGL